MKKISVAFLALAGALAITPVAFADSFDFTFSGAVNSSFPHVNPGTISFGTVFITGVTGPDGGWDITSISGNYTNTGDGLTGSLSLYTGGGVNGSALGSISDGVL